MNEIKALVEAAREARVRFAGFDGADVLFRLDAALAAVRAMKPVGWTCEAWEHPDGKWWARSADRISGQARHDFETPCRAPVRPLVEGI